ncbi:deoxyribose-phosphate aldolase [Lutibacter citreus]|uniref:deoxyribose-phosphate aldolase n=1 Tax=Lutibacter citreus TaxID=2138210 RepID=UPI000DBE1B58|nr:deoxyribose-phosphate aldolase [Lutibacter citreus]
MCEVNVNQFLESTYLKTPKQAGITQEETKKIVEKLIIEAVNNKFKLVMIRPNYVSMAKEMVDSLNSYTLVGTVIGFHEGTYSTNEKLEEAKKAIEDNADELDFVANYEAFKAGKINLVKSEIFQCTKIVLDNNKVAKWIIEIAALTNEEIAGITQLIRNVVLDNFGEEKAANVFVKSSTGFFKTENNKPNGATFEGMEIIIENAKPLPTKAAGGVKNFKDALKMVEMGVKRIGTSSALAIADGNIAKDSY